MSVGVLAALVLLAGCGDDGPDTSSPAVAEADAPAVASSDAPTMEVDVELGDLWIEPASIDVEPGTVVTFNVTNTGVMEHDFAVDGTDGTAMLAPGASESITVGPFETSTYAWCTLDGHREAGMEMEIVVG